MALLTATEVTTLVTISASAATIAASGKIALVRDRLTYMLNNWFTTDLDLEDVMTFDPSALTIVASASFESYGFAAGDDIFVYGSYRNDGYYEVASVDGVTLHLASAYTVVDELSGTAVLVSVVRWPRDLKEAAARMIAFDWDVRPKKSPNVKSRTFGPLSESFETGQEAEFGYPSEIMGMVSHYRVARLM